MTKNHRVFSPSLLYANEASLASANVLALEVSVARCDGGSGVRLYPNSKSFLVSNSSQQRTPFFWNTI